MYVKFTEQELKDLRQYWFSKYCNEVTRPEKAVFGKLYNAYDDLIKALGYEERENIDMDSGINKKSRKGKRL